MSTVQRLLIRCGALIIVAVLVIGAFSLGVYVAERGWTAGPPSIVGPGGPPPPQGPRGGSGKQPPAPGGLLPKDKARFCQSRAERGEEERDGEDTPGTAPGAGQRRDAS